MRMLFLSSVAFLVSQRLSLLVIQILFPTHNLLQIIDFFHNWILAVFGQSGKIAEFKDIATGNLSFKIPAAGTYRIESIVVDKTPGTFDKKAYKTAYHMATTVLDLN